MQCFHQLALFALPLRKLFCERIPVSAAVDLKSDKTEERNERNRLRLPENRTQVDRRKIPTPSRGAGDDVVDVIRFFCRLGGGRRRRGRGGRRCDRRRLSDLSLDDDGQALGFERDIFFRSRIEVRKLDARQFCFFLLGDHCHLKNFRAADSHVVVLREFPRRGVAPPARLLDHMRRIHALEISTPGNFQRKCDRVARLQVGGVRLRLDRVELPDCARKSFRFVRLRERFYIDVEPVAFHDHLPLFVAAECIVEKWIVKKCIEAVAKPRALRVALDRNHRDERQLHRAERQFARLHRRNGRFVSNEVVGLPVLLNLLLARLREFLYGQSLAFDRRLLIGLHSDSCIKINAEFRGNRFADIRGLLWNNQFGKSDPPVCFGSWRVGSGIVGCAATCAGTATA